MDNNMANDNKELDNQGEEKHGPLISFSLDYFSNGMMAGTSSSQGEQIDWNKDGSVTLTSTSSGGGKNTKCIYNIKPEAAQKIRDFVKEKHLAELAKKDLPLPQMFDNFTSASISMEFDDSSLGGSPFEYITLNCGPAYMAFRKIEIKLSEIFEECRETGECTFFDDKGADNGLVGFMGLGGIIPMPPVQKPAEPTVTQPAKPGCWTCTKCGFNENEGKFCSNCGYPR